MTKPSKEKPFSPVEKNRKRTAQVDRALDVLMQIFGMGICVNRTAKSNQINVGYGMFIIGFHVVSILVINIFYELSVNYSQNSLTRSSFWIQYYGRILINITMICSVIKNRELIYTIKRELASLEAICHKYKKELHVSRKFTIGGIAISLTTMTFMLLFDLFNNPKNQNIFLVWNAYVPGITMIIYTAYMSNLKRHISAVFVALNSYLGDFAKDMPWQKKLMMRVKPKSHTEDSIEVEKLHEFFVVHNNTFKLTVKLNHLFSFQYLIFMIFCLHGIILIIYLVILDLVRIRTMQGIFAREHHFTEFWSVMYFVGFFMIILASHKINEAGNEASAILHNIRSIYYNLNEYSSVYAFQLMFTKVNTTAASFFSLDYSTLLGVMGITIKYVFILMQFDQGADMYYTEA